MKRKDRPFEPRPLAGSAAERVNAIVEAAERAAEKVIDDAEAQARAYAAEAEAEADRAAAERLASLGEMTTSLIAQAEAIRRQADALEKTLIDVQSRLGEEGRSVPVADRAASARIADLRAGEAEDADSGAEDAVLRLPRLAAVESPAESPVEEPPSTPKRERGGSPAGARLLATQMAVSGSGREEIAARLRSGFEIEDTDAILDAILGPEE